MAGTQKCGLILCISGAGERFDVQIPQRLLCRSVEDLKRGRFGEPVRVSCWISLARGEGRWKDVELSGQGCRRARLARPPRSVHCPTRGPRTLDPHEKQRYRLRPGHYDM